MAEEKRDSYTKLFNPILEALYKQKDNLSSADFCVILFVIRSTYGWQKTRFPMSAGYISNGTGIPERTVKRSIKKLLLKHYLIDYGIDETSRSKKIGLNKKYSQWNREGVTDDTDTHDTLSVTSVVGIGDMDDTNEGDTDDTQKRNIKKKDKKEKEKKCSQKGPFLNEKGCWELPDDDEEGEE